MTFSGFNRGLRFPPGVNSENMKKNNVRAIRQRKRMSLERLVEASGIPLTTLHRIENGQPVDKYRSKLAAALRCDPDELDTPEFDAPSVPIAAEIKFKSYIKLLPEKEWLPTEYFEGLPKKSRAIRVAGGHLKPHFPIDTVFYYDPTKPATEKLFLERQCMVEIPEKKKMPNLMLCWVSRGSKPGVYMLTPYAGEPIFDTQIVKAFPILYSRQG